MVYQSLISLENAYNLILQSNNQELKNSNFRSAIEIFFENSVTIYFEVFSQLAFPAYEFSHLSRSVDDVEADLIASFGPDAKLPKPIKFPRELNYNESPAFKDATYTSDWSGVSQLSGFVTLISSNYYRDYIRRAIKKREV